MQKKLLLLCMVVNCVIVQASETDINSTNDYVQYTNQQKIAYQKALVDELSAKDKAIDEEDQKNKKTNEDEEEESKNQQYDGKPGYWGATPPTEASRAGREFARFIAHKENKNAINEKFSDEAKKKKNTFTKEILPTFKLELEDRRYKIYKDYIPALIKCREDHECYHNRLLSPTIFTNSNCGTDYELELYKDMVELSAKKDILLTIEELRIIAENNPETKTFFDEMQKGLKDLAARRKEILDIKEDQNDQGALSQ